MGAICCWQVFVSLRVFEQLIDITLTQMNYGEAEMMLFSLLVRLFVT